MTGPDHRPAVVMCARCSTPAVVHLSVEAIDDPHAAYPCHHVTTMAVCDDHVPAAVGVILVALNARPTLRPRSTP